MHQEPDEADALLLAAGEELVPAVLVVQAVDQMAKTAAAQCGLEFFGRGGAGGDRIAQDLAQRAVGDVSALRQEGDAGVGRDEDPAGAPRPQPGDRADQRALARAALAGEQDAFAAADLGGGFVDHHAAVELGDGEVF